MTPEFVALGDRGCTAELYLPTSAARRSAVVLGAEATGPNRFSRRIASCLAALGHLTIVPDYLQGRGPADPDDYDDLDEVRRIITGLDFKQATLDLVDAVDHVRSRPDVDAENVVVWGYCTGATLALLTACLDRSLAAAVLFYPSQMVFDSPTDAHPTNPFDLLWALRCPTLIFYGDSDQVMPPDRLRELERRCREWNVEAELVTYPGADHVFAGDMPGRYREKYDRDSWDRALRLIERVLP